MSEPGRHMRNRPVERLRSLAMSPGAVIGDFTVEAVGVMFTPRHLEEIAASPDLDEIIEQTRHTERNARRVREWLELLRDESRAQERRCPTCEAVVLGRADRVYCSTACRVKAHRSRNE